MKNKKIILGLIVLVAGGLLFAYSLFFPKSNYSTTTTHLAKEYPELHAALLDEKPYTQYKIPNLDKIASINVETGKVGFTANMVPQGLVIAENYLILSAYNKGKEFQSVLFLLDKNSGKYIKTIVLPGTPHVGGLAYDFIHQNLWITTEAENGSAQISALSLQQLEDDDFAHAKKEIQYLTQTLLTDVKSASFITYYNEELWVGDFTKEHEGELISYFLNEQGFLDFSKKGSNQALKSRRAKDETFNTEKKLQGVAFYHDTILFSQSFGDKSSHLLFFANDIHKPQFDFDSDDLLQSLDFPAYLEQIFVEDERLYAIFESDAKEYRSRLNAFPINHVLVFDFKNLIQQ